MEKPPVMLYDTTLRDGARLKLGKGLLLECRRVLLPWNATLAELLVLGDPLVEGSGLCLKWPNERILGGLSFACISTEAYSPGLHYIRCQPITMRRAVWSRNSAIFPVYLALQRGAGRAEVYGS